MRWLHRSTYLAAVLLLLPVVQNAARAELHILPPHPRLIVGDILPTPYYPAGPSRLADLRALVDSSNTSWEDYSSVRKQVVMLGMHSLRAAAHDWCQYDTLTPEPSFIVSQQ